MVLSKKGQRNGEKRKEMRSRWTDGWTERRPTATQNRLRRETKKTHFVNSLGNWRKLDY